MSFGKYLNLIFDIFSPSGELNSVHLLRYSRIRSAIARFHPLGLDPTQPTPHQSQLVNSPGNKVQ